MLIKLPRTIMFLALFVLTANTAFGQKSMQDKSQNQTGKPLKKEIGDSSTKSIIKKEISKEESPSTESKARENKTEEKKQTKRKRIVDPKTIKERRSLFPTLLLSPFRAVAPAVTGRITRFEENREYQLIFGGSKFPISPQFGSISPGSGFGLGFVASTKDYLSKDFRIKGSSIVTLNGYAKTDVGVEITPQKFADKKLKIELIGQQRISPEEDFFGNGAGSFRSDRATFFHRKLGAKLSVDFQPVKDLKAGGFAEIARHDITDGSDPRGAPITTEFDIQTLAGIDRNIRLFDTGVFIEVDKRDKPENAHSGWFTKFNFTNSDSLGRNNFGWLNYKIDSRAYIPIGSKHRVVALRFLGDFSNVKGNSDIPFFRLAKLGDSETLRGYEFNRFQGRNAMHLNVEYRFKLMQGFETSGFRGVEGIFFGDFGQVYDRKEELTSNNLRATWGGGFQLTSTESVVLAILYAQSPESGSVIFRFGKTF